MANPTDTWTKDRPPSSLVPTPPLTTSHVPPAMSSGVLGGILVAALATLIADHGMVSSVIAGHHAVAAAQVVKQPHSRDWWNTVVPQMSDERFRSNFRVPRHVFEHLVSHYEATYPPSSHNAARAIPAALQVGAALYRMGHTMPVRAISEHFGLSAGSVINFSDRFARMVVDTFEEEYIKLPTTDEMHELAHGWLGLGPLRGIIGALDGTLVPIARPADEPDLFYTRKGQFAPRTRVKAISQ